MLLAPGAGFDLEAPPEVGCRSCSSLLGLLASRAGHDPDGLSEISYLGGHSLRMLPAPVTRSDPGALPKP